MRTLVRAVSALPLLVAVSSASLQGQSALTPVDSIFAVYAGMESPGCAVAVVDGGRTILAKGFGMASLEHGVPITPTTAFYAASVSKQFTAFAVALLAHQGKLSLDDDIRKWIPEVPDFGKTVTIRHLIHHTSGLRDYFGLLGMTGWPSDGPITEARFLDLVSRQKSLNFDPGARHLYSNTGYVLLSILVKRVSGQSLREYADSAIFRPLGMTNSHFRDDHRMLIKNRALAYAPAARGGWQMSVPGFDVVGDGGLYTTVEDLAKWVRNFDDHTTGGDAVARLVLTRGRLATGDSIPYAFGLAHNLYRGEPTIEHGGAYGGYRSHVLRFPKQGFAVAALCNSSAAFPAILNQRVANVYLANRFVPVTLTGAAGAPVNKATLRLSREQLARYAGVYWDARAEVMRRIEVRDSALVILGTPLVLLAVAEDRFLPATGTASFAFVTAQDGSLRLEETAPSGEKTSYQRMAAPRIDAATLAEYTADYVSEELDVTWRIEPKDGALVLRQRVLPDQTLQPAFLDAFTSPAGVLRFVRGADGRVTGFIVGAGRVTGFRFEARPRR